MPESKKGDPGSVSFYCFVQYIPRIGELITLDDGAVCRVDGVHHKLIHRESNPKFMRLIPAVSAIRVK
jgi:hypothetical protein